MPSPFPGMDPYLEDPARWPSLHHYLIGHIGATLNRLLPPTYLAKVGERLYVVQAERSIYPDVAVHRQGSSIAGTQTTAVAAPAAADVDSAWEVTANDEEYREAFIEVVGPPPGRQVICVIEVLSPANKAASTEGRRQYLTKQREVLGSSSHLLEIDLLRNGVHTVAAPLEKLLRRGPFDYLVSLSSADDRSRFSVWARTVRDHLPRFRVPLLTGAAPVVLDLQAAFAAAYDDAAFARDTDYRKPPVIALRPADAQWADQLLAANRLAF